MWKKIKWFLFGETRVLYFIAILNILIVIGFYVGLFYILFHFISKYW